MKKILFASMIFLLISCQKEISGYEIKTCGLVINKLAPANQRFYFDINYSGVVIREEIGRLRFVEFKIGDKYCK